MNQKLLTLLLFASWIPFTSAQAPVSPALPVSLKVDLADGLTAREAVVLALRQNLALLTLRKAREAEAAEVARANALSDPEVRVGWTDLEDVWPAPRHSDVDVAVRWTPPRPGERGLNTRVAIGKVHEADGEVAAAEQRLAADILLLHTKIVLLDGQISLAEQSVKLREQMIAFVEEQVKAEARTAFDQNVAELALADARSLPTAYRTERVLSLARLASELNLPPRTELIIQVEGDPLALVPRSLDLEALVNQAWTRRPELSAASARYSGAQADLELRRNERKPWFSFVQVGRQFQFDQQADSWGFRVGFDLPLFKWNEENLKGPVARLERFELEQQTLKRRVALEVEELVTELRAAYGRAAQFKEAIEPITDRDVELSRQAVTLGRAEGMQELMAGARRLQRRQAYLADLLECRRLEIELDRATGSLIPE